MHLSSFFYRPVVEETFFRTALEDASNIVRGRNLEVVFTTRQTCSAAINRGTLRPEASGRGSPLKKPIRATAGPCGRNTTLRSLTESKDGTRSCGLSSATMARPRVQSDSLNGLLFLQDLKTTFPIRLPTAHEILHGHLHPIAPRSAFTQVQLDIVRLVGRSAHLPVADRNHLS